MILTTLTDLFIRDLNRVRSELNLYRHEANIWAVPPGINNSAGNLSLHLVGNLNTYIGAELGQTGYIRHRDLEFSRRDVPRTELIQQLDQTIEVIERTLANVDPARLADEYPLLVLGEKTSTEYFLVHLATHLSYHLGQINYHRRLVEGV
ncbi:DinB family protein [Rudanella lutea]|uniref:DinB family protein n=1 Tax=Rudanella lutea TaxID=451374 RepID=UPI0003642D90|nr:DinB family protein [Rudanella lutea]